MKTYLDWSEYTDAGMGDAYADIPKTGGDFAKAVAVCINSGRCETKPKGVMCPSFRLEEDPSLSTGARIRLLKEVLNGPMAEQAFLQPGLGQAMDLCISCKGCRRECENSVDMSRIKIEYLAQTNALQGLSLRARLFSELPKILTGSKWFGRLTAWRNRFSWLALLGEKFLGISAETRLPQPAARTFALAERQGGTGKPLLLFADTFCRHYNPEILQAASEVLQAAGFAVDLAAPRESRQGRPLCCGRTYLSQGRVDAARREARRVVEALLPQAEAGVPIIGLEPSCLLTLRDEYSALGLGEAARVVAGQALLFEEFLAREASAGRLDLPWADPTQELDPVLVHGHCHQKAFGAMKSMRKVLKQIPGLEFEMIDAACCGMAGSFGLEAEHADMARAMARQSLLPALNSRPRSTVVANGFSCRQQIQELAQRPALHLAQLLRARLAL